MPATALDDVVPVARTTRRTEHLLENSDLSWLVVRMPGVLALNRLLATSQTDWDTANAARALGLGPLRTVEEVLRAKAALPPAG